METHHPHHVTHKKKWGEYLLEFFMLFLAVFLGFIAENIREHSVERTREKEYMISLVDDIRSDTATLNNVIATRIIYINRFDSLTRLLNRRSQEDSTALVYYYSRHLSRSVAFTYHNRTVSQLKNSGALRLVRNKKIADSIAVYDNDLVARVLVQQEAERDIREKIMDRTGHVLDAAIFEQMIDSAGRISMPPGEPKLITNDRSLINDLSLQVHYLKIGYRLSLAGYRLTLQKATSLLSLLQKEYDLEKE